MKAARLFEYDLMPRVVEIPRPEIAKPSDVIVRIAGAGVCRTDLHIMEGEFRHIFPSTSLPFTLGHENSGWIEEVGSSVTGFKKGDPVVLYSSVTCGICPSCRYVADMYCRNNVSTGLDGTDGGFAEYLRTSVRSLIPVQSGSSSNNDNLKELAPLADAGITAYHAIKKLITLLRPGTVVAAIGVGGVGHIGIQLLKTLAPSTVVVALDVTEERVQLARELGADHALISTPSNPETIREEVRKISGGVGADIVIDFVGEGLTPSLSMSLLRRGGTYSIVGYGGALSTTTHAMITKEISMFGNLVGTYNDLRELLLLYEMGKIRVLTSAYGLEEVGEVFGLLKAGKVMGRAVLVP